MFLRLVELATAALLSSAHPAGTTFDAAQLHGWAAGMLRQPPAGSIKPALVSPEATVHWSVNSALRHLRLPESQQEAHNGAGRLELSRAAAVARQYGLQLLEASQLENQVGAANAAGKQAPAPAGASGLQQKHPFEASAQQAEGKRQRREPAESRQPSESADATSELSSDANAEAACSVDPTPSGELRSLAHRGRAANGMDSMQNQAPITPPVAERAIACGDAQYGQPPRLPGSAGGGAAEGGQSREERELIVQANLWICEMGSAAEAAAAAGAKAYQLEALLDGGVVCDSDSAEMKAFLVPAEAILKSELCKLQQRRAVQTARAFELSARLNRLCDVLRDMKRSNEG